MSEELKDLTEKVSDITERMSVMENIVDQFKERWSEDSTRVQHSIDRLEVIMIKGLEKNALSIEANRIEEEKTRQNIGKWLLGCLGSAVIVMGAYIWKIKVG